MDTVQITTGMMLKAADGTTWRCFAIIDRSCRLIATDTTKFHLCSYPVHVLNEMFLDKTMTPIESPEPVVVNMDRLPEIEKERYTKRCSFINEVKQIYGPSFMEFGYKSDKTQFKELYEKYGFAKSSAYRYLLKWLQSGMNYDALVSKSVVSQNQTKRQYKSKPGQKGGTSVVLTDEVRSQFDYGVDLYRKNRIPSMELAYDAVIRRYYSTEEEGKIVPYSAENRPTIRQFRFYLKSVMNDKELAIRKTSEREFENDCRALLGSTYNESLRPGFILEADAMEMDMNCVSQFSSELNIGRPILYSLIDRYSHCIVAFHVGFDNNSLMGLTNLLVNLMDDRQGVLDKHHINMDLDLWPAPFIPEEIRCDRGSDFVSHGFEDICKDLFVLRTLEEGAKGSMKGMVERSFGMFNIMYNPFLEHKGLIQKRYDSNHKKEACLTIQAAYNIAALYVAYKNATPMPKFKLSPEMIREGVDKSPISIWNYGVRHLGAPTPVTDANRDSFTFKLLPKDTATITREGVNLHGLIFQNNNDDDLVKAMITSKLNGRRRDTKGILLNDMEVRYDPRSINHLYYEKNGRLEFLELVPSRNGKLHDLTWDEYTKDYKAAVKQVDKKNVEKRLNTRIQAEVALDEITSSAAKTFAICKDIKKNRRIEKNQENFDNNFHERLTGSSNQSDNSEENVIDVSPKIELPTDDIKPVPSTKLSSPVKKEAPKTSNDSLYDADCPEDLLI